MPVLNRMTSAALALAALPLIARSAPDDAARCSIDPFYGSRSPHQTLLLAMALPDTLEAGAGGVTPSGEGGHAGPGDPRPVFGQVVEVTRYAVADSVVLARAFERSGSTRVVIVPWDYGADCRPTFWGGSAAWVPVGEPGAYKVRLRPDSLWVDGVPTFDAFMAAWEPYPFGTFLQRGYGGSDALRTSPSLTAEEYFDLLRELPDLDTMSAAPDAAWAAVLRWQEAHPELAEKFPATRMIENAARYVAYSKARGVLRTIDPAVKGTWQFAFTMDGGSERVFYARTRPRATTAWRDPRAERPTLDPERTPPVPEGYSIIASGALTLDELPSDCTSERDMDREGYIGAAHPPPAAGAGEEWIGAVDSRLIAHQFPDDSALALFAQHHMRELVRGIREDGDLARAARFTVGDDGVLRVEQTVRLDDGRSIVLRAQRVSLDVMACEW